MFLSDLLKRHISQCSVHFFCANTFIYWSGRSFYLYVAKGLSHIFLRPINSKNFTTEGINQLFPFLAILLSLHFLWRFSLPSSHLEGLSLIFRTFFRKKKPHFFSVCPILSNYYFTWCFTDFHFPVRSIDHFLLHSLFWLLTHWTSLHTKKCISFFSYFLTKTLVLHRVIVEMIKTDIRVYLYPPPIFMNRPAYFFFVSRSVFSSHNHVPRNASYLWKTKEK